MNGPEQVEFHARDGLLVGASCYEAPERAAVVVLCHRSHFNRAEYRETAPRLRDRGMTCLALDQRSGMAAHGVRNQTYDRAKELGLPTGYASARPDIEAAVDFATVSFPDRPVIVVGSSYSASLALVIAAEETASVAAIAAFSPGECLKGIRVTDSVQTLNRPTFVTASADEMPDTHALMHNADPRCITWYEPSAQGAHGSRSLWQETPGSSGYMDALVSFLATVV